MKKSRISSQADIAIIKEQLKEHEENQIYLAQKIGEHDMFIQKVKNKMFE